MNRTIVLKTKQPCELASAMPRGRGLSGVEGGGGGGIPK